MNKEYVKNEVSEADINNFNSIESELYNNEIIGIISMCVVLSKFSSLSFSKTMLILPIATHNALISYLNDSRTHVKSLEQLIIKKPEFFSNFNQRFYSLLELSVNSILISIKLGLTFIDKDGELRVNNHSEIPFFHEKKLSSLGIRASKIISASAAIADLLYDDVENLYLQLRVEL